MFGAIGILVIFVMVFGGYTLAGGNLSIILHSLPFEMMIIGGAAFGAFIIANDSSSIKKTAFDVTKVFKGHQWGSNDYRDLLCLLFELIRISRSNPVSLEEHVENPLSSTIFGRYPRIKNNQEIVYLICDTFRAASMNYDDPNQVEEVLDKRIEANLHHALSGHHALQNMADALPALGIVAAVLGVIKTMASIDKPPEILGQMIGSALVGTFLGVFLAYGIIGPFASRIKSILEEDSHFQRLVKEVLVANLYNHPANICIEVGRQNTPNNLRPTFDELEKSLRNIKQEAA